MAILRRIEKAMMRAMCGVKMVEERRSQELMSLLGLKDTLDGLAAAGGVRWYGHVLKRDNGDVWGEERWIMKWRKEEGVGDRI